MDHYSYDRTAASIDMDFAKAYCDSWSKTLIGKLGPKMVSPKVLAELLEKDWFNSVAVELRDLKYRSSKWMPPAEYIAQMKVICPGYNEFTVRRLAKLILAPEAAGIQLQPAREYSVCIYIKGPPEALTWLQANAQPIALADEVHLQGDELRLWWD